MKNLLIAIWLLFFAVLTYDKDALSAQDDTGYSDYQLKWIKEKWTGDEKPYRRMRIYIDKFIAQGQKPATLANKYRAQVKNWADPLSHYRWAYPAYLAEKQKGFANSDSSRLMQDMQFNLERAGLANPPRNYEYSRLRFLVEARYNPNSFLAPMGERLVQRNPKDYEARFLWAKTNRTISIVERKKMRANAQVLLEAFPRDPRVHMMFAGFADAEIDPKFKNQQAINRAIAAYRKVQSFSKPGDKYYKAAQSSIDMIRRMQKWYAERPNAKVNRPVAQRRVR